MGVRKSVRVSVILSVNCACFACSGARCPKEVVCDLTFSKVKFDWTSGCGLSGSWRRINARSLHSSTNTSAVLRVLKGAKKPWGSPYESEYTAKNRTEQTKQEIRKQTDANKAVVVLCWLKTNLAGLLTRDGGPLPCSADSHVPCHTSQCARQQLVSPGMRCRPRSAPPLDDDRRCQGSPSSCFFFCCCCAVCCLLARFKTKKRGECMDMWLCTTYTGFFFPLLSLSLASTSLLFVPPPSLQRKISLQNSNSLIL